MTNTNPPHDDDNNDGNDGNDDQQQQYEDVGPLIQPIAPSAIQRIVAGQAVTDLSSAVKELVDNAIDAGARRVSVKLYDQGLEGIEVSDNGSGVPPSSRPLMAMKHATSKLRQFDDLYQNNVNDDCNNGSNGESSHDVVACAPTLGFRGEALFCLANLSRSLVVSTRSNNNNNNNNQQQSGGSSSLGEQFAFDTEGKLISTSIQRVPRPIGTTVTVRGLFEKLPVRRVDLCKRIKWQRGKLMKMMQGYAILCLGTQFNVADVQSSNSKTSKSKKKSNNSKANLTTSASSKTLEERTASVLGTKFLAGLTRIEIDLSKAVSESSAINTTTTTSNKNATNKNAKSNQWKVQGLISHAPASIHSATARDLQFFSINGRPVDLPSVSRTLGDVWRTYDPSAETKSIKRQRPACVLAFTLPNDMFDVNLSPDKREVMFTEEKAMGEAMREGLERLWSGESEGKFKENEVESRSNAKRSGGGEVMGGNEVGEAVVHVEPSEGMSSSKGTEKELTSANENNDENDRITPKLSRRNKASVPVADTQPIVTPPNLEESPILESSPVNESNNYHDRSNGENGAFSTSDKTLQPKESPMTLRESNKVMAPTQLNIEKEKDRGGWDQMQLPERARQQQDRRAWEQMKLQFQRVEKKQNQQLLSDVVDGMDRGRNNARHEVTTNQYSSTKPSSARSDYTAVTKKSSATNASRMEVAATRQKSKRQKRQKQNFASFLDSFSFGSTKQPVAESSESDSECDSNSEESETVENSEVQAVVDNLRIHSRKANNSNFLSQKRPRRSSRGQAQNKETDSSSSQPSLEEGNCNDPEPEIRNSNASSASIEAVWNSFSGTKNVIDQSHKARLMMHKNRKCLRSSVKRKRDNDGDVTEEKSGDDSTVTLCPKDFLHMSIIGQFNLGFILARCRNHNLWILDQHACDEKYNFERLCKETVIHEQKLIAPLPIELSPSEEHCVLEHMDVFERNGFRFLYESEKEPRHRLSLTALPHSGSGGDGKKAVQFGRDDVGALCAMLGADGTSSSEGYTAGFGAGLPEGGRIAGVNAVRRYAGLSQGGTQSDGIVGPSVVRLPKAIAMFASRACRGSIMIGTALSHKEQMDILTKLDKTDIPWNCAHGRPTMSHIRSLTECLLGDDNDTATHVAGPSLSVLSEE